MKQQKKERFTRRIDNVQLKISFLLVLTVDVVIGILGGCGTYFLLSEKDLITRLIMATFCSSALSLLYLIAYFDNPQFSFGKRIVK